MHLRIIFSKIAIVVTIGLILGCGHKKEIRPLRFGGLTQGTTYQIMYFDSLKRDFHDDVDSILRVMDRSFSLYNSQSLLSRINRNELQRLDDEHLMKVFQLSDRISKQTSGAFDPTVGPLVSAWGFGLKKKIPLSSQFIDSLRGLIGWDLIQVNENRLIKKDARIQLDFNAIAQGYTVDVLAEYLESKNINSYLIEVGGEVRVRGTKPDGHSWVVGIEKPEPGPEDQRKIQEMLALKDRSLATSGNYRKFIEENGIRYGHTIDPSTGYPARNQLLSVTVMAEDCATADALATAFMVMGKARALSFLSQHPEFGAYFIESDSAKGFVIEMTDHFRKNLIGESVKHERNNKNR